MDDQSEGERDKVKDKDGRSGGRPQAHREPDITVRRDIYDWLTFIVLALAFTAAAAAAYWTKVEAGTAAEVRYASQRAWLAPGDIIVDHTFRMDIAQEVHLSYGNVGGEPADNIASDIKVLAIPKEAINDENLVVAMVEAVTNCETLKPTPYGWTVYPTNSTASRLRLPVDGKRIDLFLARTHYLAVAGCFAYETMKRPHVSVFCRYLDYAEGRTPTEWLSSVCRFPEHAD